MFSPKNTFCINQATFLISTHARVPFDPLKKLFNNHEKIYVCHAVFYSSLFFRLFRIRRFGYAEFPGKKYAFRIISTPSILQWNTVTLETMQGPTYDPMIASRIFAWFTLPCMSAKWIAPVFETYSLQQAGQESRSRGSAFCGSVHGPCRNVS